MKERPVSVDLLNVLRTGKPANWGSQKNEHDWHRSMETEEFAASFTAAMDCRGVYLAQAVAKRVDLSSRHHLLDIAGGSGIYACALVAHWPNLRATVLEKPPVDRIAAGAIAKRGYTDRVRYSPATCWLRRSRQSPTCIYIQMCCTTGTSRSSRCC